MPFEPTHYQVTIVLPVADNDGNPFPQRFQPGDTVLSLDSAVRIIASLAGGCTAIPACGYWQGYQSMKQEPVLVIRTTTDDPSVVDRLRVLAGRFADDYSQECIYFNVVPCLTEFIQPPTLIEESVGATLVKAT